MKEEKTKDVELIIRMPEDRYNAILEMYDTFPVEWREWGLAAIKNGNKLLEGHGKIVDVDDLDITTVTTDDYSGNEVLDVVLKEDIDNAHALIEADKEPDKMPDKEDTEIEEER